MHINNGKHIHETRNRDRVYVQLCARALKYISAL